MKRAWLVVAVAALAIVVRRRSHADPCPLAATWSAGDVHQYEVLVLAADGAGRWALGSYDDAVEPDAQDLSWEAAGTTLTVTTDDGRRAVTFAIGRSGDRCKLSLDDVPLPRSHERFWSTGGL